MRGASRIAFFAALAALGLTACGVVGGYSPEDPVSVTVTASDRLNDYGNEPHALVVYAYKIDDPDLFRGADEGTLLADVGKPVAGGIVHQSRTFSPGDNEVVWKIGAMGQERYQWLGIYAAYRDAVGSRRAVVEIPSDGELKLVLDPKGIGSFVEK